MAESKVKNENYIVIQGFMINQLNLKGTELIIYACIYGFSQDEQRFNGSLQYLADWAGCSKRSVIRSLNTLTERGLLIKTENIVNGIKFCDYRCTNVTSGDKMSLGGGDKMSPNNIDIHILGEKENILKEKVGVYGEFNNVKLSDDELQKLKDLYPDWQDRIETLSAYMMSKKKRYSSHYATIRAWARKEDKDNKSKGNSNGKRDTTKEDGRKFVEQFAGQFEGLSDMPFA